MNPRQPSHILKQWIDKAEAGDPSYYSLHFTIDDNTFLPADYKENIRKSSTGLFYKRNYLGLWCMAEGAIFDFFERKIYVVNKPPKFAEYWIAAIDYGTRNNFACLLIGVNTGKYDQGGVTRWVEKEYVWDSIKNERQKTASEYANDVEEFLSPYGVKQLYIDPSALPFKLELQRRGMHVVEANNDVEQGIIHLTSEMKSGKLVVCEECTETIREIESYIWDSKAAEKGEDRPVKKDDHCIDALRYGIFSHQVKGYQPYNHEPVKYLENRFNLRASVFR
jgi:PBSX family phage terminase large subunit